MRMRVHRLVAETKVVATTRSVSRSPLVSSVAALPKEHVPYYCQYAHNHVRWLNAAKNLSVCCTTLSNVRKTDESGLDVRAVTATGQQAIEAACSRVIRQRLISDSRIEPLRIQAKRHVVQRSQNSNQCGQDPATTCNDVMFRRLSSPGMRIPLTAAFCPS